MGEEGQRERGAGLPGELACRIDVEGKTVNSIGMVLTQGN